MNRIIVAVALAIAPFLVAQQPEPAAGGGASPAAPPPATAQQGGSAAGSPPAGNPPSTNAEPVVMNVSAEKQEKKGQKFLESAGMNVVELGDDVVLRVAQWEKLRAKARAAQKPVTLYINGLDAQLEPVAIQGEQDANVTFRLERNDQNKDLWRQVFRDPTEERKTLNLSVGVGGSGAPLLLAANAPNGAVTLDKITLAGVGIFWLIVIAIIGGGLLFYCSTTDMLRNGPTKNGQMQPFSLGRTQMAFWFLLIVVAYVLIWTFTGERDTIPASLLALMGISATTAMGSAVIDGNKEQRNAAATENLQVQKERLDATVPAGDAARPAVDQRIASINATMTARNIPKTKSTFLHDLLTDDNGQYALHRYQIVGWTLVLGIIFVATVIRDLTMPEFSGTLLALMGISSGTYLGFKFPSA